MARKRYRKVSKSKSHYEGHEPWEMGHLEARDAMRRGEPKPVGQYLRLVTDILQLISSRLDPGEQTQTGPRLRFVPKLKSSAEVSEWDSDHSTVSACIERGAAAPIGWYLRDVAETLGTLANILDPTSTGRESYRAQFVRKSRGRPKGGTEKLKADSRLRLQVFGAGGHRRGEKEAAVVEVMHKTGVSRATAYRASRRPKK